MLLLMRQQLSFDVRGGNSYEASGADRIVGTVTVVPVRELESWFLGAHSASRLSRFLRIMMANNLTQRRDFFNLPSDTSSEQSWAETDGATALHCFNAKPDIHTHGRSG